MALLLAQSLEVVLFGATTRTLPNFDPLAEGASTDGLMSPSFINLLFYFKGQRPQRSPLLEAALTSHLGRCFAAQPFATQSLVSGLSRVGLPLVPFP